MISAPRIFETSFQTSENCYIAITSLNIKFEIEFYWKLNFAENAEKNKFPVEFKI